MNPQDSRPSITRRTLLRTAAGSTALVAGAPLLAGCGDGDQAGPGPGGGESVPLPAYVAADVPPPDLPESADGVQPGYFGYPTELVTSVETPPGSGDPLHAMVITYNPPATDSQYIKAVNEALNAPIDFDFVTDPEYETRFATVSASGDLPELIQLPTWANLPRLGAFLQTSCVDVSDQLSGDNVKKYPNLAALPTLSWRNARVGGRIYGVPKASNPFPRATFYRKDIVNQRGVELPGTADEFLQFCRQFTDPGQGKYAIGDTNSGSYGPFQLFLIRGMFKVPNLWRDEGGSLTYYVETEEFKESIAYTRKLWEAGVFHPDSATMKAGSVNDLFGSGRVLMFETGNGGWFPQIQNNIDRNPDLLIDALVPFGHDGGDASAWLERGAFSFAAITSKAADRVEELLGILNYCAAPFGTVESQLLNYGVEGVHFERTDQGPVKNDLGKKEVYNSYRYLSASSGELFYAGHSEDYTKPFHAWQRRMAEIGLPNPTLGYYSETASTKQANLSQLVTDEVIAVVLGRKEVSALDELPKTWAGAGGDQVRREFEESIQQG